MPHPTSDQPLEQKFLPFEVKEVDVEGSTFTGFSAAIGNRDLGNDIIEPGAFSKTIKERVSRRYIKLLDNHNSFSTRDVWGTVVEAREVKVDQRGDNAPSHKLLTTFEVSEADPNAQIALRKVAERHLDQLSIGFRALSVEFEVDAVDETESAGHDDDPYWAWVMGDGVRRIKEIQWWETSLVIWAMNPEAQILANSVDSLLKFAQKAAAAGTKVPEDAVRETIRALQELTGDRAPEADPGDDVRRAVADVRELLDKASVAIPKDAVDRLHVLANDFSREHGEDGPEKFVTWVVDNLPELADEGEETKTLSSARRPTYDGTESTDWSKPTLGDYVSGLGYDEGSQWGDLDEDQRGAIAAHTLIGEASADTFDEANSFPVVNPSTGDLNENALDAANSRAPQADISEDTAESIQEMARTLLEEEFDREMEDDSAAAEPATEEKDSSSQEELEEEASDEDVGLLLHGLRESVDKLAETLGAGALGGSGDTPDETADPTDDHAEDVEEAANHTEPEEAGRGEHFLSGDELAVAQLQIDVLRQRIAAA